MNKQSRILCTCAAALALTLLLSWSSSAQVSSTLPTATPTKSLSATTTAASTAAGSSKDVCLGCHGPFDKLTSATANYTFEGGEKTSPHRYVPHDSKDIPECSGCHKPHPVPLTSKEGLAKADAESCYKCHHARVLQCGTCH